MSTAPEAKHTPGPWDWFTTKLGDKSIPRDQHMKFLFSVHGEQGFAHTVGMHEPMDTANANLIAAAPDLLNALQGLYDGCTECGSAMCDHKGLKDQYANAIAAIQKARGGQ